MMPSLSSAEAAAPSWYRNKARQAAVFRIFSRIPHTEGEPSSLAIELSGEPTPAAGEISQASEDIDISLTGPQRLAKDPSPETSSVPDGRVVKIPYIRRTIYIFPDASHSISQAHRDRFPVLQDIFRRNIEQDIKLSEFTRYISYELRMCGHRLADATPSIVIFCPFKKLKKLKSLLTRPHITSQLEQKVWMSDSDLVTFGLFFWGQPIDMLALHDVTVAIPRRQDAGGIWGVEITESDEGRRYNATMSCMIKVGGARFGLTTAHAFDHPWGASPGTHDMDSDDSVTDDDDYDMATDAERDDQEKEKMGLRPDSPLDVRFKEVRLSQAQVHIPPREDTSAWVQGHANLDWALVDLGLEVVPYPNAIWTHRRLVVKHLPKQCIDVFLSTRAHLDVPATLYNVPSYIGGEKGSQATEVWTIGCVPESFHVQKGDSGSIVTDAKSGQLYGMVVAVNPFGDIHIIPFTSILAQVKEWFQTKDVSVLDLPHDLASPRQEAGRLKRSKSLDSPEQKKLQWL